MYGLLFSVNKRLPLFVCFDIIDITYKSIAMESIMQKYYRSAHLVYDCKYHVIFCPKYRRPIFKNGLDEVTKLSFLETATAKEFKIIEMEIMPDHVHLLISCNPRFGIMECIGALKHRSAVALKAADPTLTQRLPSVWTRSAFIATVGSVSLETVKQYIESQKGQ